MYNIAVAYAVILAAGILAYCFEKLMVLLRESSDEKSEQRRAAGRVRAYAEVRQRREIAENREYLWREVNR